MTLVHLHRHGCLGLDDALLCCLCLLTVRANYSAFAIVLARGYVYLYVYVYVHVNVYVNCHGPLLLPSVILLHCGTKRQPASGDPAHSSL